MKPHLMSPQKSNRPRPIVLAYPRIYQKMLSPEWRYAFDKIIAKCFELTNRRPDAKDRHDGYFGLGGRANDKMLHLLTVWAVTQGEPDIFILGGYGDGFGPGHSCPPKEDLRRGQYGALAPIPFL